MNPRHRLGKRMRRVMRAASVLLAFNLLCAGYALSAESKDTPAVEKRMITKILASYNEGKKEFERANYLAAIGHFKRVIEMEEDFYIVYTPYAQRFIQQAQEKIKDMEEKWLGALEKEISLQAASSAATAQTTAVLPGKTAKPPDRTEAKAVSAQPPADVVPVQPKEAPPAEIPATQAPATASDQAAAISAMPVEKPVALPQKAAPPQAAAKEQAASDVSPEAVSTAAQSDEVPQLPEFKIDEADELLISVWQNRDLDTEVSVRPDGKISFPLIGDVQAKGLTLTQLDEEITKKLQEYVRYPEVSVVVKKLGGKKIIVLGEVRAPGVYSVTGNVAALEGIGLAGGFTDHAVVSSVILIRGGFQNAQGMRLNLTRTIQKLDMTQNVLLQPADIVYVPKKFIANVNYAVTQLLGPLLQATATTQGLDSH